jgi:hypothetical protein
MSPATAKKGDRTLLKTSSYDEFHDKTWKVNRRNSMEVLPEPPLPNRKDDALSQNRESITLVDFTRQ